ncbi:MAG: YafY family protein [Anaerolineae bacterium]|jgi:predicted DNA-binding transcriptional regulator YafY
MRADRLLSILMLLQARGRMTARALAEELEVSVRTIYRDLDALSAAGVPVYAERGPGGGCALLDSYRTTLTGLTQDEVRALFTLSLPAPLADLGLGEEFKAALHKLSASLPDTRRPDEARARQRIHLDPAGWFERRQPAPHLRTLHQALWQERLVEIVYELPFEARATWQVAPYGLVAKADAWHLVCSRDGHLRVYRLSRILEARLTDSEFAYPHDFDLAAFWGSWCAQAEENRSRYRARVRVAPGLVPYLPRLFGEPIEPAGPPDGQGWLPMELVFESLEEARRQLLGLGGAVKVLAPLPLRESVADFARQAAALYMP